MSSSPLRRELRGRIRLERAVAPNLFDVVLDPELVFTLILANLMSPRLWDLRHRLQESPGDLMQQTQQFLDHHFEHVSPARVAEIDGVFDLDLLDEKYGKEAIESTRANILAALEWRVQRGTMNRDDLAIDSIEQRKFPAYTYGTIDEVWAFRRILHAHKHKPFGLTCCLDEATIFSALLFTTIPHAANGIAFLGSPTHYTVLTWLGDTTCWFYSKHELFSPQAWSQAVADTYVGDRQAAFDDRLPDFDRIITACGSYTLNSGENSIPETHLAAIIQQIESFFGFRPAQLESALRRSRKTVVGQDVSGIIAELVAAATAEEACERVRQAGLIQGQVAALRTLYTYRSLDVPDPSVYLQAARDGSQIDDRLPRVLTVEDAMRAVESVTGEQSIFEDSSRIAMPNETVRFSTGTVRDKALLLHVLLERVLQSDEATKNTLETLISDTESFVQSTRFCISVSSMTIVPNPQGNIRYRLAGNS